MLGFFCIGLSVGYLAWGQSHSVGPLLWLLVLPVAWGKTPNRIAAALLMFGYFLGGARGLPGGATVFFGDLAPHWFGGALWIAASAILTAPFVALWSKSAHRAILFPAAICVLIIPPIGLIGWVNPIVLAGALFPGAGWSGVALTLWLMAALVNLRTMVILMACAVAVSLNGLAPAHNPDRTIWRGVDTHFARLSSAGSDDAQQLLASMKRVDWVIAFAKTLPEKGVTVLPETILGSFNGLTEYALSDTEALLSAKGARLIVGAEIPLADGRYRNSLLVLGARGREAREVSQNIPVPISMWKPWESNGAVASVFGPPNIIQIGDRRAGIAICYEQLLPYALLSVLAGQPDTLVAASNVWWARSTSIPNIQRQTSGAFARLFGVGIVSAFNI